MMLELSGVYTYLIIFITKRPGIWVHERKYRYIALLLHIQRILAT